MRQASAPGSLNMLLPVPVSASPSMAINGYDYG